MTKKIIKIALKFFAVIFILLTGAVVVFQIYSPRYIIPYVVQKVENKTNGRYILSVNSDSVKVGLLNMHLNLGPTEFFRDSTTDNNSGIEFLDKFDVHARFESLHISAMNIFKMLISKKIIVEQIALRGPSIVIHKNIHYRPETADMSKPDSIPEIAINYEADSVLADTLAWNEFHTSGRSITPYIKVDTFLIEKASFIFYDGRKKYPIHELYGLEFELLGFTSDGQNDIEVLDASVRIDSVSTLVSKNIARLTVKGLNIQPDLVRIEALQFGHIVDRYRINKIKGFRASWLDIGVKDIIINGINPGKLISERELTIDKTSIGYMNLYLFKDKEEKVINPEYKALPTEQVRSIPMPVFIDTLEIRDGDLVVDMEAANADKPGRITLNQLHAQILNITNIPDNLSANPLMELNADFLMMNSAHVNLNSKFKIDSEEDQYWVKCHADPFEAGILNGFLGSQFFVEFPSGKINNFNFEFEGNNKVNVGTMDLEYEQLKVGKLKDYDKYLDSRPKTGFLAGVGNILITNRRSVDDKNYKQAVIYYEKEYNRDFIHCTIMSLLSGVSSSMGFSSKNLEKREKEAGELGETDTEKSAQKAIDKAEKEKEKEAK